ncbi:MAG: HAMP domain-containing histidine kinase, partial [Eubacterium sp.]|nr:HAMP domain-containing histidine kinase [Eubacterium sp.]
SGFADYLYETGEGVENEERLEYLKLIKDQADRLSKLSQNTLLLARLDACQILTDKENFSLTEQIRQTCILMLKQFEKKGVELDLGDEDAREVFYYGNPEIMDHVWINLLGNALKFTPAGGRVSLQVEEDSQGQIQVTISDTGEGMDQETRDHMFERYYQGDQTNLVKGNGIGLAIVWRVMELVGGQIQVDSEPGKGSKFIIRLRDEGLQELSERDL